jgi:hypothetical protein
MYINKLQFCRKTPLNPSGANTVCDLQCTAREEFAWLYVMQSEKLTSELLQVRIEQ